MLTTVLQFSCLLDKSIRETNQLEYPLPPPLDAHAGEFYTLKIFQNRFLIVAGFFVEQCIYKSNFEESKLDNPNINNSFNKFNCQNHIRIM